MPELKISNATFLVIFKHCAEDNFIGTWTKGLQSGKIPHKRFIFWGFPPKNLLKTRGACKVKPRGPSMIIFGWPKKLVHTGILGYLITMHVFLSRLKRMSHLSRYGIKLYVKVRRVFQTYMIISKLEGLEGYVKVRRVLMSKLEGYWCRSYLEGYVKLRRVCQTKKGLLNSDGYVKVRMICQT